VNPNKLGGTVRRKLRSRSSSSVQSESLGLQDELEQMSVSELMRLMQAYNIPLPPSTYSTVQQGEMAAAIMDSGKVSYPASVGEAEVLAACAVPAAYDGDDGDELVRQVRARMWPMLPADDPDRLWVWFANSTAPVTPVACAVFYVVYQKEARHDKHKQPLPGENLTRHLSKPPSSISPSSSYLLARVTEEKERERETTIPPMVSEEEICASCAVPSGYAPDNGPELVQQTRAGLYPDLTAGGVALNAWFSRSKQPDAHAYWYHVYRGAYSEEKQRAADAAAEAKTLHHRSSSESSLDVKLVIV